MEVGEERIYLSREDPNGFGNEEEELRKEAERIMGEKILKAQESRRERRGVVLEGEENGEGKGNKVIIIEWFVSESEMKEEVASFSI